MSLSTLIEVGKAVHEINGHIDNIDKHMKAIERTKKGKTPYPGPKNVEDALRQLNKQSGRLRDLARTGLGKPKEQPISMDKLADLRTRASAKAGLQTNLRTREEFVKKAKDLITKVQAMEREAELKKKGAQEMAKFFEKLVKYPVGFGTVPQAQAFHYYQLFERTAGALSNVSIAAGKAFKRISPELKPIEEETKILRQNLKGFGVVV
jgi:hypothetical protein